MWPSQPASTSLCARCRMSPLTLGRLGQRGACCYADHSLWSADWWGEMQALCNLTVVATIPTSEERRQPSFPCLLASSPTTSSQVVAVNLPQTPPSGLGRKGQYCRPRIRVTCQPPEWREAVAAGWCSWHLHHLLPHQRP